MKDDNPKKFLDDFFRDVYRAPQQEVGQKHDSFKNFWMMMPTVSVGFGLGTLLFSTTDAPMDFDFLMRIKLGAILMGVPSIPQAALLAKNSKQFLAYLPLNCSALVAGTYATSLYQNLINYFS